MTKQSKKTDISKEEKEMNITKKEIVTKITVEIDFDDFANALSNLISDVQCSRYVVSRKETREKIFAMDSQKITIEEIKRHFTCFHLDNDYGDVRCEVIDYIAYENGWRTENVGFYDRHLKVISPIYFVNGSHI